MTHEVVSSPAAMDDLLELHDDIADQAGPNTALACVERIQRRCLALAALGQQIA